MPSEDVTIPGAEILGRAMRRHRAGELAAAERDYLEVAALGYRRIEVLRLLAGLALEANRLDDALARARAVLELAPEDVPALQAMGVALQRLARWNEAADAFAKAAALAPGDVSLKIALAAALQDAGRYDDSLAVLQRAAAVHPDEPLVQLKMRNAVQQLVPAWHVPMMNDAPRNQAFERAIRRAIARHGPQARVLDIGTGSGLLSLMAVRAGAAAVTSCEVVPAIAAVAREVVQRNGYGDRIRVLAKRSTELVMGRDIEEPADILVSEILSSSVLSEYVLPTFEDAMARLLKPGATVIPQCVTAVGCLAAGPALERMAFVDRIEGFDLSPFGALASPRLPLNGFFPPWTRLSADIDLLRIDLTQATHPPRLDNVVLPVAQDGLAVGIAQWLRVDLDGETVFTNPPEMSDGGGWQQVLHTFTQPLRVTAGQRVTLTVGHDRSSLIVTPSPVRQGEARS
jgi:type II protein arginine methyltransferase